MRTVLFWVCAAAAAAGQVTMADVDLGALASSAETRKDAILVFEVMKSARGAGIPAMLVGLPGAVPVQKRPRLLVVAGLNPDHAGSVLVAARIGSEVLDLAAGDAKLRDLLQRVAIEVIPCLSVDAVAASRGSRFLQPIRTNLRLVDDDRDGISDEDPAEDLDGDGIVTSMRVRDPLGEWRVSDDDPRLMVKADRSKGEVGAWRIESEGLDNDGDGAINEDPPGGVDFDRNFPHGWKEFDRRAGTSPCSEAETHGLIEHVLADKNIAAVLVLGHRDSLVETPAAMKGANPAPDGIEVDDRPLFEVAGESFRKRTGFEKKLDDKPDGAFHQWAYFQYAVPAFAAKVFEPPKPPQAASQPTTAPESTPASQPTTQPAPKTGESDEGRRLLDSDTRLSGKGFVSWKPYKHPTLGDVEVGGFVPLADVNPTMDRIPDLARRHAQFVLDLAGMIPRAVLQDVETKALGAGLHEVTAVVRNEGRFPTVLRMGTRTRAVLPSRIVLDLPAESFELGERRTMLEPLGSSGQGRKLRWIVRSAAGKAASLSLWTEKAGEASATLTFGEAR